MKCEDKRNYLSFRKFFIVISYLTSGWLAEEECWSNFTIYSSEHNFWFLSSIGHLTTGRHCHSKSGLRLFFFIAIWYASLFFQSVFQHRYAAHGAFKMSKGWERVFFLGAYITQGSS